jgi:hypothetical protein
MEKDCQQCLELLPWYVNGSLSAAQAQQIFKHLEKCAQCSAEHQFLGNLRQHVRGQDMPAPAPAWGGLEPRLHKQSNAANRDWKWSMIPAVAAVAVVAVFVVRSPQPSDQGVAYRLLTSDAVAQSEERRVAHPENILRLLLSSGHDKLAASQLFSSIDVEVVSGPSPRGVYTVAVRREVADREAFIQTLRNNNQIDFAEWIETP